MVMSEKGITAGFKSAKKQGLILYCYVVYHGSAVRVNATTQTRVEIEREIEILKP